MIRTDQTAIHITADSGRFTGFQIAVLNNGNWESISLDKAKEIEPVVLAVVDKYLRESK